MLPAAGAAPGQAGPPARPQPPRSHQLQLQLRALRLPQSAAALPGKLPSLRGAHSWGASSSLCFSLPTRLPLRDTRGPRGSPRPSGAHCVGLSRLALGCGSPSFGPRDCPLSVPGAQAGGLWEPFSPSPAPTSTPLSRGLKKGLCVPPLLEVSVWKLGLSSSVVAPHAGAPRTHLCPPHTCAPGSHANAHTCARFAPRRPGSRAPRGAQLNLRCSEQ